VDVQDIINDMKIYRKHRHFTDGYSMLLFAGDVKKDTFMEKKQMRDRANP